MKKVIVLIMLIISLDASEYYSKADPKEVYNIKASVSGEVIFVNDKLEGNLGEGSIVVKIDDKIDLLDLKASKNKLKILLNNLASTRENLKNSKKIAQINRDNYERVKELSSYSKIQKDAKELSMINSKNQTLQIQSSVENLKTQREDLKLKIEILQDKIKKKNISVKSGDYIYKIYPNIGDYLNPGSKLMEVYDIQKALLVIFVPASEIENIKSKKIYLDGEATDKKIDKIWQVADSVNISSYRVEILIDKPKQFSKLVKIEFR